MEDWMRRRIGTFKREKERSIEKLSGKSIHAMKRDLPYIAMATTFFMWMEVTLLVEIRQFEAWYDEY